MRTYAKHQYKLSTEESIGVSCCTKGHLIIWIGQHLSKTQKVFANWGVGTLRAASNGPRTRDVRTPLFL